MNSERQSRQHILDAVTRQLTTPKLIGDQISSIPVLFGISMMFCGLIPPHSRVKLYIVLAAETLSIIWASWLYILWKRRAPSDTNDPAKAQAWTQYSMLVYHLARTTTFFPTSLGALAASLLTFSLLQVKPVQILLVIGYGVVSLVLWINRYQLLRISVEGIQNAAWRRFSSCIMIFGVGLAGIGAALGTLISRLASKNTGFLILGLFVSAFALMLLPYGFLEASIVKAFIAKDEWRRK
jgi:hypothetical protein